MNNRSWLPERELFENICMASRETDEEFKGGRRTKGRMLLASRHGAQSSASSSHILQLNSDYFCKCEVDYEDMGYFINSSYRV